MDNSIRNELDQQDWNVIIKRLTIYAYSRLKFWNLVTEKGIKGYSAEDIALDAITFVYSGEWNWNPKKSDLLTYLKFHVVNGLVANLARSKEVLSQVNKEGIDAEYEFNIEENINAKSVTELIRAHLKDDKRLLNLFDFLYAGMKRKDVCNETGMSSKEFDNDIRRLKSRILQFKNLVITK